MAVGLELPGVLHPVRGVELGVARAGIRKPDRRDLVVLSLAEGTRCAAVFTRNAFRAAPVIVAQSHLQQASPRALVINTGNANAGTGDAGITHAEQTCRWVSESLGCQPHEVLPFSTGVIGEPLPVERLRAGLPEAIAHLAEDGWLEAAYGIMTTDTLPKAYSKQVQIDGRIVTITGICKGAGMIRPDMATMLAFIATDVALAQADLDELLRRCVARSFNCITVDGDTSTNDACCLLATGAAGGEIRLDSRAGTQLEAAVGEVCIWLAQAIVRDGEGATKFLTIAVEEAGTPAEARLVADAIAHSPLVKTACYASDPNWGRILAAVGRAGVEDLDVSRVAIRLDEVQVVTQGQLDPGYREAQGARVMAQPEIRIGVQLGRGTAVAMVWTCDFSHDYVTINAEYRT
jgi:glutamate N-acetyltransferase/amino-acid N-acetyltransferase